MRAVGRRNGLAHDGAVSCDYIITIDTAALGRHIGFPFEDQETDLARAVANAFALQL